MTFLRIIEAVHGHLGILATVALLHPALRLRKGRPMSRGTRWSVLLTTAATVLTFGIGLAIYPDYRALVKPGLFELSPATGLMFETKEHLAFAVVCLAVGAGVCAFAAPKGAPSLRRAAAWAYAGAGLLCLLVVILGTYVASRGSFAG